MTLVEDAMARRLRLWWPLDLSLLLLLQLVVDLRLLPRDGLVLWGTASHVDSGKVIGGFVVVFGDVENLVIGRFFSQEKVVFHFVAILLFLRGQLHFG